MASSANSPQKRVLVVDDSKFVRTTFAAILKRSFGVREEADGEAAWHAIETDPSLVMVLTDLDMPRLDGYGLLTRIRGSGDARVRALPVVIISGSEDHLMPPAIQQSNLKHYKSNTITEIKEYKGYAHLLPAQAGWEEIADYVLDWALRNARTGKVPSAA